MCVNLSVCLPVSQCLAAGYGRWMKGTSIRRNLVEEGLCVFTVNEIGEKMIEYPSKSPTLCQCLFHIQGVSKPLT